MTISGLNSGSANTLFSSLSGGSGLYSSLGDYGSIRSGSYGKLLNAYYKDMGSTNGSVQGSKPSRPRATDNTSRGYTERYLREREQKANSTGSKGQSYINSTAEAAKKSSASVATGSKEAVASLDQLRSSDTFKKNSAGNYDTDSIRKAVQSYVDSYNNMIDGAKGSKSSGVNSNMSSLTDTTNAYKSQLEQIGVTIGSDNKLTLNQDTFNKADMANVQSLFDKGSYGYSARTSAYMAGYYARQDVSNTQTYGSNGSFSLSDLMSTYQTSI